MNRSKNYLTAIHTQEAGVVIDTAPERSKIEDLTKKYLAEGGRIQVINSGVVSADMKNNMSPTEQNRVSWNSPDNKHNQRLKNGRSKQEL